MLLTGASGMVGRNLLEHPQLSAWEVLTPGRVQLDLTDFAAVVEYLELQKPDLVLHAAGLIGGIQANLANPVDFLLLNLDMGRNLVKAARQVGVNKLINLGSSCMYPRDRTGPLREDMVLSGSLEPSNEGYALAKIVTARLCKYIREADPQRKYKTIIPCNLYGRFDKFDPDNSHLIPAIIHKTHLAVQAGQASIEVWGDGTARREFMYAGDFADALIYALEHFDSMPNDVNIGLGVDFSVQDYYEAVGAAFGYSGNYAYSLDKPVGMKRKLVSIERQDAWGWSPKTSLAQGIRKTVDYYFQMLGK